MVESRYVVPDAPFQRLIQSYLVAATGSGSDSPARTISASSWRRYDWRHYDTARTDDHLPKAAGNHRRAASGQSDPEIAAALGCSVWTVRKWRRRGQHQGRTDLSSQIGHPTAG